MNTILGIREGGITLGHVVARSRGVGHWGRVRRAGNASGRVGRWSQGSDPTACRRCGDTIPNQREELHNFSASGCGGVLPLRTRPGGLGDQEVRETELRWATTIELDWPVDSWSLNVNK